MHPPPAGLRLAVDLQAGNRIQLIAEVEADRSDRRLVAEPGADRVAEIAQHEAHRLRPDVAAVEEQDAAEIAVQPRAQLLAEREHAVAADREPRFAQRAHLEASPSTDARGAAEEIALGEQIGR